MNTKQWAICEEALCNMRSMIDTPDKWCKERMSEGRITLSGRFHMAYCLVGSAAAFDAALNRTWNRSTAYGATLHLLETIINEDRGLLMQVAEWNDAPERTHADVMALLDKAIARCQVNAEPKETEVGDSIMVNGEEHVIAAIIDIRPELLPKPEVRVVQAASAASTLKPEMEICND